MRRNVSVACLALLLSYAALTCAEPPPNDLTSCTPVGTGKRCAAAPSCDGGVDSFDSNDSLQLDNVQAVAQPCPALVQLEYFSTKERKGLCRVSLSLAAGISKVHFGVSAYNMKTEVTITNKNGKLTLNVDTPPVMIGTEKEAKCDPIDVEKQPDPQAERVFAVLVLHCTEQKATPKPETVTTDGAEPATAPTGSPAHTAETESSTAAHAPHDDDDDYEEEQPEDPTTTHAPHPPDDHTGLIIGLVLGAIFLIAAFAIFYQYRKYHKRLPPADFDGATPTYSAGSTPPTPSLRSEKSMKDKNMLKKVAFMFSRETRKKQLLKQLEKQKQQQDVVENSKKNDENSNKKAETPDKNVNNSDKNVDNSDKNVDSSVKKIAKTPARSARSAISPAKNPKSPGKTAENMFKV